MRYAILHTGQVITFVMMFESALPLSSLGNGFVQQSY